MFLYNLADNNDFKELDGIDFSSWLARLVKSNKAKVHIKMSIPGSEVAVLEKMVHDDTLALADRYEINWTYRTNPYLRGRRIYIQLMFDSYGFDCLFYTNLKDVRQVFLSNGTFQDVRKHYDWKIINELDTYAHYVKRPDVLLPKHLMKRTKRETN